VSARVLLCAGAFALASGFGPLCGTRAEESPPTGPAQIFQRQADHQDAVERARTAPPAEAPVAPASAGQPPPAGPAPGANGGQAGSPHTDPHPVDSQAQRVLREPTMASAVPAPELARGTIHIDVADPSGAPLAGANVVLGVMAGTGGRSEQRGTSGADGSLEFKSLPIGSTQAYRVNVLADGAKFSSTPFRLPEDGGYRVRIPVLATTRSDRLVFQLIGQTVVELRDDRLHITQQARVANAGDAVFVLPEDGLLVELPSGFTAFQWQDQMSDQRGEQVLGKGFRLRGSLPPGNVTLGWGFDVPRDGASARVPVKLPFRTYTYRVISEAPEGLSLRVAEFPDPERVKDEGRTLLFTQVQRAPSDPPLASLTIKLDGIPGPGPGRYVAVVLAAIAVLLGLFQATRRAVGADDRRAALTERKQALIAAAKQADAEHARGDTGPEFHAARLEELSTELALVLRDEEALPAASAPSAARAQRA
jgi:hypothetical protein